MWQGATNVEIARALFMSEDTARNHVSKVFETRFQGSHLAGRPRRRARLEGRSPKGI